MSGAKRAPEIPVGQDEPRTPTRSLPSYEEPTPETHRKLTREGEAELALNGTVFTKWTPQILIALFLVTITAVPVIQLAVEWQRTHALRAMPMFATFGEVLRLSGALPHANDLRAAEKTLESDSVVSQWLLPHGESVLIGKLHAASEQVYPGRDGWLFYRPDVDYVTGPPFLAAAQLQRRTHAARVEPDPVKAIVRFRDQLAARGIELVVLPVPTKATVQGEMLSNRVSPNELLQNASFAEFQKQLTAAGVQLFDPTPALIQRKNAPVYLEKDTHWRPETMQFVTQHLAAFLNLPAPPNAAALQVGDKEISGVGDLSRMLKLPNESSQTVTIHQVTSGHSLWRANPDADVLLLGDSFSNIFSLEALGWGESAGFAEHLSVALGGRPLDCILRNSDGAFATREMLANELARGRDRLKGKKLVIWEFVARELAFGNWKLIDLKLGAPAPSRFFSPAPGEEVEVTGTVEALSSVPRPGSVPYADHVMSVQLADVQFPAQAKRESVRAIVYLMSMHENVWTPAARMRIGDHVMVRLRAWSDVSSRFEQINRSELDDPELQLEEPAWGELLK
ncbi:MAG: hypothetical protein M3032_04595 [Verrucomicrobiota bacterium]|nr:hypothetical protein [Verrucomicrobiota bacterium]